MRILRHLLLPAWWTQRVFSPAVLRRVEMAIHESEARHYGELRFVVEAHLGMRALLRRTTAHDRAIELFSGLRVWDTQHNSGVLIYVLLADRVVEIVADRGIHRCVGDRAWAEICGQMEQAFAQGRFEEGALAGIEAITALLTRHFPAPAGNVNELPDQPLVL